MKATVARAGKRGHGRDARLCLALLISWILFSTTTKGAPSARKPHPPHTASPASALTQPAVFDSVRQFRLDNGMLFLLLPRHSLPALSGRIRFRAGEMDSPAGMSGLPHMFEHMAFKGTDSIGTRDIRTELTVEDSVSVTGSQLAREMCKRERADTALVARLKGQLEALTDRQISLTVPQEYFKVYDQYSFFWNAWTSRDFTEYETDLPSSSLEVWMLMESERIQHPSFREFYRERDVVLEERSWGEDRPALLEEELRNELAYTMHPYRLPLIGCRSDIETLTQAAAERFHQVYYVPGNAVAALVGDFNLTEARRLIQDYFGDIPAGPTPPEVGTTEPEQQGMRRGILRRGTERELTVSFHSFSRSDHRSIVAEILAAVLSKDVTSRLDLRLDIREKAAGDIWADPGVDGRAAGLFVIHASPLEGFTNERVEAMIWEELGRVVSDPVTPEKLESIKASRRKSYFRGLATNGSLAEELVSSQMLDGTWLGSFERIRSMQDVSVSEVTELARSLFRKDLATVIYLEPAEIDTSAGEPGAEKRGGGQ